MRIADEQRKALAELRETNAELLAKWRDSVTTSTVLRLRLMDRGMPSHVTREEIDGLRKLFEESES